MSDENSEVEAEAEQSDETTNLPERGDLDPAYDLMLDTLEDEFGDLSGEFERVVRERIKSIYDNREEIKEQAQQQSQGMPAGAAE